MSHNSSEAEQVAAEAARWFARLSSPQCTGADRAACELWLAADSAHAAAFLAARNTAERVTQALQTDPRFKAMAGESRAEGGVAVAGPNPGSRGPLAAPLRVAAALGACLLGATLFMARTPGADPAAAARATRFSNPTHAVHVIRLGDGTQMYLDADSEVDVTLAAASRRLQLLRGRAGFDVSHDRNRPFTVEARGTLTTTLGTRFQVDLRNTEIDVTLAQGSISVERVSAEGATPGAPWRETLQPGEQLQVAGGAPVLRPIDSGRALAWAQGRLEFDGTPLREALELFNRYASTRVVLGDETLADAPIGGSFMAGTDSESFVRALSAVLPLHAARISRDEIVLFQGRRSGGA